MVFCSHVLLAVSGALLAALGISLFRREHQFRLGGFQFTSGRVLGAAFCLVSIMATVVACASFMEVAKAAPEFPGRVLVLVLAGLGVALWFAGALFGGRRRGGERSIRYLTLASASAVAAWWGMSDGEVSPAEIFMFAGLAAWVGVSMYSIATQP